MRQTRQITTILFIVKYWKFATKLFDKRDALPSILIGYPNWIAIHVFFRLSYLG